MQRKETRLRLKVSHVQKVYETDSHLNCPIRRAVSSARKCTAQNEGEDAADTMLCQGTFQSSWRGKTWTHAELSNVVRKSMAVSREWLGNVWS